MKSWIGRITGSEIKKNRGSSSLSRLLQTEVTSVDDVQTVEQLRQAGLDSAPLEGQRVFFLQIGSAWKLAFAVDDGITPDSVPGEYQIYSQDDTGKKTVARLKPDGSMDIVAAAGLTIAADTEITGDLDVIGDLTVTGAIAATGDIVADSAATAISLLGHTHLGNMGFDTAPPTAGSPVAPPSPTPLEKLDNHDHDYTWTDPAGSGTTDPPN